ncbi:MAG: hypothetical protein WDN25_24765 [Acetobacteraceae bacterium]
MFVSRVVIVPADGTDAELRFPLAGADDQLEYAFDFAAWLAPLDRIANATVLPDVALALAAVAFTARRVTARLGPATAPGAYVIRCAVVTPQGREKSVTATVMLQ